MRAFAALTAVKQLHHRIFELTLRERLPSLTPIRRRLRVFTAAATIAGGWLWHRRDTGGCPDRGPDRVAAARPSWRLLKPSSEHGAKPMTFTLNAALLQPTVALIAGILILLIPRILNFIVAIYLIFVGVTGLWPHLLSALPH